MQQLKEKVAEYDAKIKQEMEATLVSVRNNLTMTKRQVALIQGRVAGARGEIVSGQERGVEFNMMKREVDTNRELYNGLLQQLKQVGVAGGWRPTTFRWWTRPRCRCFRTSPSWG
jgi:succinoglycan biosynthesis transport protein ExoP